MSLQQRAIFFLCAGLIMLMGTVGGVESSPDLATWDGVYLTAFAIIGIVFMAIGASYANEGANQTVDSIR